MYTESDQIKNPTLILLAQKEAINVYHPRLEVILLLCWHHKTPIKQIVLTLPVMGLTNSPCKYGPTHKYANFSLKYLIKCQGF